MLWVITVLWWFIAYSLNVSVSTLVPVYHDHTLYLWLAEHHWSEFILQGNMFVMITSSYSTRMWVHVTVVEENQNKKVRSPLMAFRNLAAIWYSPMTLHSYPIDPRHCDYKNSALTSNDIILPIYQYYDNEATCTSLSACCPATGAGRSLDEYGSTWVMGYQSMGPLEQSEVCSYAFVQPTLFIMQQLHNYLLQCICTVYNKIDIWTGPMTQGHYISTMRGTAAYYNIM